MENSKQSAQHTPGPWKVEPTTKAGKKFFVVRELRNEKGHWAGLEFMKHANGGARHFPSVADARAAIAKATGSA